MPTTRLLAKFATPLTWLALGTVLGALFMSGSGSLQRQRSSRFSCWSSPCLQDVPVPIDLRDQLPWEPLLTDEEVQRSQGYYGTGAAMRRVAGKLLAGKPISVSMLGGSITMGMGATKPEYNYPSRFFQIINASFPHKDHVFSNKGTPASTSTLFSVCAERMASPDADLIVLEFTYNDPDGCDYNMPARRAFEQLLRKLLKLPNAPAIIMLHHYAWFSMWPYGLYYRQAESNLQVFANYYDFPAVSMRNVLWPLMSVGIEGFKADKVVNKNAPGLKTGILPAAEAGTEGEYLFADRIHPSDRGHQIMAEALVGPLARAIQEESSLSQAGRRRSRASRQDPRLPKLPPPMIANNHESETSLCALQEDFKTMVTDRSGFEWRPERPNATSFMEQKWGWTGLTVGDWAEITLDTRNGGETESGVSLVYLRSYERMGTARVDCKLGCQCASTQLDATWPKKVSLMQIHTIKVTAHKSCRIRVTIIDQPGKAQSDGHKITLMGVVDGMLTKFASVINADSSKVEAALLNNLT